MIAITALFWFLTTFLLVASIASLTKFHIGMIRSFDFPRIQLFWLGIGLIVAAWVLLDGTTERAVIGLLTVLVIGQAAFIAKFTAIWRRQSHDADDSLRTDVANHASIMAANIKKSNRDYGPTLRYIKDTDPDIAIIVEVDQDWIEALAPLRETYANWITIPKDNGYGMCLMSKLEIPEHTTQCHITDDVPSITAKIVLRSGAAFRLYAVHPEPPVPTHDTEGRDSEIAHVGLAARDDPLPAVVTGDLNDVAWSTTTRQFQRLSRLLDPRVGRGFFNTFHADYPLIRWPLDHLFHDQRFRLVGMARGPNIGSDHFPVLFKIALAQSPKGADRLQDQKDGEEQDAKDMIASEKHRDREPIGRDWEDED